MKLYVLRHAIAAERDAERFPDDGQRPLTDAGLKKMERIARALHTMDLGVDMIFSSPFLRARETAEIARKGLELENDQLVLTNELLPFGNAARLIADVKRKCPLGNPLLVGHEPDLSEFISLLLTGDTQLCLQLKKGGICCLSMDELIAGKCATLEWLLNPAWLSKQH